MHWIFILLTEKANTDNSLHAVLRSKEVFQTQNSRKEGYIKGEKEEYFQKLDLLFFSVVRNQKN